MERADVELAIGRLTGQPVADVLTLLNEEEYDVDRLRQILHFAIILANEHGQTLQGAQPEDTEGKADLKEVKLQLKHAGFQAS